MKTKYINGAMQTILGASLLLAGGISGAATQTVTLTAQRMTTTLPDGKTVPMWGYCVTPQSGNCASAWAPGPTIKAAPGDTLQITLKNSLPIPTSIVILGQLGGGVGTPTKLAFPQHAAQTQTTWPGNDGATFTPPKQAQRVESFGTQVAASDTQTLQWNNLQPGTYLYETGTLPSIQAPMGLYGVLIVTSAPTADSTSGVLTAPGTAYPGVSYDYDTSMLFSEIDPVQNSAVDNAAANGSSITARFDSNCAPNCYPAAVNYSPTYFLINGHAFDNTAPQSSVFAVAGTKAAQGAAISGNILVRLLNAGSRSHIPSIVGLPMSLVGEDGNLLPGTFKVQNEVLMTAGKTHDVLVSPPSTAAPSTYRPRAFAIFDRQLSLSSGSKLDSGMQGFLQVAAAGSTSGNGTLPAAVVASAVNDSFPVPLNTSINGNVKLNDIAVATVALTSTTSVAHGTLSFNSDGTFIYTPTPGYVGTDVFTYNGNGATTNEATVTLKVASSGVGAAPNVTADSYTSSISTKFKTSRPGVLANDSDPNGYPLTASLASLGDCGAVTLNADGSFIAAPAGAATSCAFSYKATNSQGTSSGAANVTVTFVKGGLIMGPSVAVTDENGVSVTDYRWIIQEDQTFKVDPAGTPSLNTRTLGTSFHRSHMPIVATGCVGAMSCGSGQQARISDTGTGTDAAVSTSTNGSLGVRHILTDAEALALQVRPEQAALDPSKHYYISILPGDAAGDAAGDPGHSMGGAEIKPLNGGWAPVAINANTYEWQPAQLSVYIYEDNSPINNQDDLNETGLGGFNIILFDAAGRSGDTAGQQTYDAAGMPLSNALLGTPGCPDDENKVTNGTGTSAAGNIVGVVYTCPNMPANYRGDPANYALAGHALIKNLTPARYDVLAHPAAKREAAGEVWWQTETLEGTQAQDAFTGVKEPVYFQEFGPPGFHTTIGFVNPDHVKQYAQRNRLTGPYSISGRVTNQHMSRPSNVTLWDSGSFDMLSSTTCQVALNSQSGTGPGIAITTCDRDGNFTLSGVPAGSYEVAIWDQWLDQIINTQAVTVNNTNVALGNIPELSWFTQYDQNVYQDLNKNGKYDEGEPGISNVTQTTRYRDGGISNQTATDSNGNGLLAELFPLFNWYVTEADTTRFKQTGVNVIVDAGGKVDTSGDGSGLWNSVYQATAANPTGCTPAGYPTIASGDPGYLGPSCSANNTTDSVEMPGALSYGLQGFISQRNTINWGRTPYVTKENGGITGYVVYSTTRPFDDQRYNVQTIWEPLVPRVTVNLYQKTKLADGTETLRKVDDTQTSSFDDFVNAVQGISSTGSVLPDPYLLSSDGSLRNLATGALAASGTTAGKQLNIQCPGQRPDDPFYKYTLNGSDQFRCFDGWHNWNQVQAAPYDGRYVFPSAKYIAEHPLTAAQKAAGQTLVSLPPGEYVVESVTPTGYEVVKEEDKNILNGDAFDTGAATPQFAGIGDVFILPDQATLNNANPYNYKNADGIMGNATSDLGATASLLNQPQCVGNLHRVPDFLSLYPQGGLVAPFAGMDRPLCDRKLIVLNDQSQSSATFFVFSEVPAAAAGAGIILDDASSEFNAAAPDFGEKASVPFVPVSVKDFNGRELSRSYSDQWGAYNVMTPSSWSVNPPTPSGYGPNMLVTCMNDPGPIKDPVSGKMITDPQYNPAYSNFCYTLPFMPGRTTYLDTPVLPIAAFAAGYNPADCSYPDTTPAIARVDSSEGFGPYLPASGGTLTISALGDQEVPNPAYAGPFADPTGNNPASKRTITRHYHFGAKGTVKIGDTTIASANVSWGTDTITVTVPAGTPSGELVVTNADGKSTVDAVTVTVGGTTPTRVDGANGDTIQAAINAAKPGDLILVNAGTYNELVIMWKPVRLQGVGASSVIINAAKYPTSKLETWRPTINSLFSVDITTGNQTGTSQVDPLPGQEITGGVVLLEPSVLGTEEGAGITVLGKNLTPSQCSNGATSTFGKPVTDSNFSCKPSRIDGVSVTGGDAGGGIYVNGWAHNLEISNNRVYGNAGAFNGGVRIGVPYLENIGFPGLVENPDGSVSGTPSISNSLIKGWGFDNGVKIHHNAITKNGVVEGTAGGGGAGGGVSICSGTDGYSVDHNWVCGNFSSSDGGGIGHIGFSQGGTIAFNQVLFNQSFQQTTSTHGGGIALVGEPPLFGATLSPGTGNVTVDSNVIRGNFAEAGQGGGIRLQQVNGADVGYFAGIQSRWHKVTVVNNIIDNNIAGWAGGGMAMADTLNSVVRFNTIASNDSTGIAGPVLTDSTGAPTYGVPFPAGVSSEPTSAQLIAALNSNARNGNTFSQPTPFDDNIIWHNRSFNFNTATGAPRLCNTNSGAQQGQACTQLVDQTTTGKCDDTAKYWDIGTTSDTTVTANTNVNRRLNPTNSVLSYTDANYGGNTAADPGLKDVYCNGSRLTPEFPGVINPPGVKNLQAAATLDEGANYVSLRYGPLTLSKPTDATGNTYVAFGDYHLGAASGSAYNHGGTPVPAFDVDHDSRPQGAAADIGADEFVVAGATPVAGLAPASHDFGSLGSGGTSSSFTFTLSNSGNAQLTGISVSFTGPFARATAGGNCGATLNAGAACTINVVFKPTSVGALTGSLSVTDSDTVTSPQTASLSGTGTPAVTLPVLSPTSWNAGTVTRGATQGVLCLGLGNVGPCQTFTLTNQGTAPLTGIGKALSGSSDYAFVPLLTTCGTGTQLQQIQSLNPGQSCIMTVQFRPKAADAANSPQNATLTVTDSIAPAQTATLSGVAR